MMTPGNGWVQFMKSGSLEAFRGQIADESLGDLEVNDSTLSGPSFPKWTKGAFEANLCTFSAAGGATEIPKEGNLKAARVFTLALHKGSKDFSDMDLDKYSVKNEGTPTVARICLRTMDPSTDKAAHTRTWVLRGYFDYDEGDPMNPVVVFYAQGWWKEIHPLSFQKDAPPGFGKTFDGKNDAGVAAMCQTDAASYGS